MAEEDLIELIAPGGCDEANHGTRRYRVDNDGRVRVPREAAQYLVRAGFYWPPVTLETAETTAPQQDGDGAGTPATDPRRTSRRSTP
jgi:hypothetical protein